jgi:hypothetical protein
VRLPVQPHSRQHARRAHLKSAQTLYTVFMSPHDAAPCHARTLTMMCVRNTFFEDRVRNPGPEVHEAAVGRSESHGEGSSGEILPLDDDRRYYPDRVFLVRWT